MILLLQRASSGAVHIAGECVGAIEQGLVVLVGFEKGDTQAELKRLCQRLLAYRVFADEQGRMNRSVRDIQGGLLLVPQFTLAADTRSGNRPSFTPAAAPEDGKRLFDDFIELVKTQWPQVECGRFGADMQVTIHNDGPVTFWLQQQANT
ncbi:MAG: D-aminoacyl-tRNA deacylase [Xanthomonadales bacterium]|jgi:D-tyrosyl-tRNA(Tyr) deacylase|nr:D-aminoacyl-tRNA deacylase [Xanthomonadales bacterium]